MKRQAIALTDEWIDTFCRRWNVREFSLFGSVLREDFGPESDIDVLVTFARGAHWTLLDEASMEMELEEALGRKVDLVERGAVEQNPNWIRRKAILESAEVLYAVS